VKPSDFGRRERSFIFIPMMVSVLILGIIASPIPEVRQFKERILQIFSKLGDFLGGAYRGSQLIQKMKRNEHLVGDTENFMLKSDLEIHNYQKMFFILEAYLIILDWEILPAVENLYCSASKRSNEKLRYFCSEFENGQFGKLNQILSLGIKLVSPEATSNLCQL